LTNTVNIVSLLSIFHSPFAVLFWGGVSKRVVELCILSQDKFTTYHIYQR